jgi:adenylate kinase
MKLLFFGPPGAGKGTQAKKVSEIFKIEHISTGDILREAVNKGSELGKKVKTIIDKGELVPDEIMNELVKEKIKDLDSFILDGYPRTIEQAKSLDRTLKELNKQIDAVVLIDVPEEEIVNRISSRRGRVWVVCSKNPNHKQRQG